MDKPRLIIDVRDSDKFQSDHVSGAINVPHTDIKTGKLPDLPKDAAITLYCTTGNKARAAQAAFESLGFTNTTSAVLSDLKVAEQG